MPRKRVLLVTLIFALTGLSFIVVLFAFGSTVHRNYQKISVGMSSNEVVAVLGPPTEADGIHWHYFKFLGSYSLRIWYKSDGTVEGVHREPFFD